MILLPEETSLVITGAWNPAVLTPNWIIQNAYPQTDAPPIQTVQALMPIGVFYAYPKYTLGLIDFTASNDLLAIHPSSTNEECCQVVDNTASKIIELLPHTPITGIGHNFEFREEQPTEAQLQIFVNAQAPLEAIYPDDFARNTNSITTSLINADQSIVINLTQYFDGTRIGVKFNFHHSLSDSATALKVLSGTQGYKNFYGNYEIAKKIISEIYGDIANGN